MNRLYPIKRVYMHCSSDNEESPELLEPPFAEPIIEDELQFLNDCPHYEDLRLKLTPPTKEYLSPDIKMIFSDSIMIHDFGKFL